MTDELQQHIARRVSESETEANRPMLERIEASKRQWWCEAGRLHPEALWETLDEDACDRIVSAGLDRDWETLGALVWAYAYPYLETQCEKAHDPEA